MNNTNNYVEEYAGIEMKITKNFRCIVYFF